MQGVGWETDIAQTSDQFQFHLHFYFQEHLELPIPPASPVEPKES